MSQQVDKQDRRAKRKMKVSTKCVCFSHAVKNPIIVWEGSTMKSSGKPIRVQAHQAATPRPKDTSSKEHIELASMKKAVSTFNMR